MIDFIDKGDVNSRYFLSSNAMKGILRRVDKLGRNLFPPLDTVLRSIAGAVPARQEIPHSIRKRAKELA